MAGWLSAALRTPAVWVASTCVLAAAPVWAQTGGAGCDARPAAHQTAACAAQAFAEADDTIAMLYADVRRALSAHERPQLGKQHSAWLRQRDLRCPAPSKAALATDGLARQHDCLTKETQARRQGLMRWLSMDSPATLP